jgi:hypothetical protein
MRRFGLLPVLLSFTTALVSAQSCPHTGTLTGVVLDPTGAIIRGASIQVFSTEGSIRTTLSDSAGRWALACLSSGSYRVQVDSPGFQQVQIPALQVTSDGTSSRTVKLLIQSVTEDVEVASADRSPQSGGANILTGKQLDGLAEDPDDLQRQLQALAAASGGMPGSALITVDGFQSPSALPPKSSIQEIRISPDMYSAEYEYPPYAGGRIEVFTKPGQDKVHGALFGVLGSHVWNANDPFSTTGTPASKQREGFELSGPLLNHKRADFALDLDHRSIDENVVVNATVLSSANIPVLFNQTVATPQRLWLANARTGWQLGSKDTLTVSFAANDNSTGNKGVGGLVLEEAGASARVSEYDLRAVNTTFIAKNLLHSSRVGLSWKTTEQTPNSTAQQVSVAGSFTGGGSTSGQLHDAERDLEFDDEVYLSLKKHTIKSGVQLFGAFIQDYDPDTFNGSFLFGGGSAPALDGSGATLTITGLEQYRRALAGLAGGRPTTYSQTSGTASIPLQQWTVAFYAQDDWKVNSRLSFSGGLRYFTQTAPTVVDGFAPRLGFSYALGKKQSWVIHARTGLFYAPIGSALSLETVRLDGQRQRSLTVYSPDFTNPLGSPGSTPPIERQRRFAAGVGITPSSQSQFSVEHTFFKSWSVNANVYYTASWGVLRSFNANAPILSTTSGAPAAAPRPLAPNLNLFEYGETGRFAGPYAFVGVNHFTQRFSLISGYLYNGFRTNAENPNVFPQSSYLQTRDWARPTGSPTHSLFAVIIYSLPFKIGSTTNLSVASGAPYDVTTGFDNNGDGVFNDRPSLVSSTGPGVYSTRFGLLSTNLASGNLQRNIGTMPSTVHLDLSLNRSFTLKEKHGSVTHQQTLRFDARSSNLLNHANYTAVDGIVGTPQFTQPVTADFGRRIELGARISF